jgi:uncharacterized surface protein with fasciclin (FAS1) repeats
VRLIRRGALLGAAVLTLAACGAATAPGAGASVSIAPAAQASAMSPPYGACERVPTAEVADQPVDAALARIPQLSTLAGLVPGLPLLPQSLRDEPALTVFAPTDAAFDELRRSTGQPAYDALLADRDRLDGVLSYHVTAKRMDAQRLVEAGKATELAYGDLTVAGTPDALRLTTADGTAATVLCGNVQTANATVFVIDKVLLPTA